MGRGALGQLKSSFPVCAFDVVDSARREMAETGIEVCETPGQIAARADVILLFLPGPSEVAQTIEGADGLLAAIRPGAIIVDLSTVDPESTRRMHRLATAAGCEYLDAPILGRPERAGKWTLPVGGSADALERARPVLDRIAGNLIHVGPSGAGNVVKLLNNLMFGTINNITAEILAAAANLGVSPRVVYETIAGSGAATVSGLFTSIGPKIVAGDFDPVFRVELMHKDMDLGLKMAKAAGATLIVAEGAQKLTEMALNQGYHGRDSSVVTRVTSMISRETTAETE
jgi:3-hydroxyisobutyrate dehydrogenase